MITIDNVTRTTAKISEKQLRRHGILLLGRVTRKPSPAFGLDTHRPLHSLPSGHSPHIKSSGLQIYWEIRMTFLLSGGFVPVFQQPLSRSEARRWGRHGILVELGHHQGRIRDKPPRSTRNTRTAPPRSRIVRRFCRRLPVPEPQCKCRERANRYIPQTTHAFPRPYRGPSQGMPPPGNGKGALFLFRVLPRHLAGEHAPDRQGFVPFWISIRISFSTLISTYCYFPWCGPFGERTLRL